MSAQQTNLFTDLTLFANDFTFEGMVNNFHFIRPWWLLAFFALFLILFLLKKIRYYQSPWQHFLPAHLANALLENSQNKGAQTTSSQPRFWLKPFIIGSCIIIALAGPAWQKLPQPVYQLERGAVLIMDMSYSMYATDVKPNRLTRARYKAIDLLKKINEGDVGLIAYAGDAFIISPLTQDIKNIELLLPSLSPDIMPVYGANALAALTLADKTLKNAGHVSGDIYWFTDDIDNEEMSDIYDWANNNDHKVNILGVGSKTGAPIKLSSGKLLKDNKGAIIIPKLPESRLAAISKRSRGVYRTMTNDDSDIKALTAHLNASLDDKIDSQSSNNSNDPQSEHQSKQAMQGDQYQEQGPWLLIIILPLLLTYFRRGTSILAITWLMPLTLLFSLASISPVSYAASDSETVKSSDKSPSKPSVNSASQLWQDLWQTSDQQAQQHYQQKDYQQAAEQFEDSQWQGSAHYKAGDYDQALQAFKQSNTAQSLYNQGNSLAQLQKIDEAIDAYKKALEKDPKLNDAKDNLAKLEELKKQQEQSQKDQESQDQSEGDDQDKKENQDGEKQSQDGQQGNKENQDDPQPGEQQQSDSEKDGEQQDDQQEKQSQDAEQQTQEQKEKAEQAKKAEVGDDEQQPSDEESLAQQASDSKKQETEQKHQQLLNKVTDDPYLLLRNKMRLEYQKRRSEGSPQGVTKKW
ncbi:VWA domain-containing protein [Colwellia demingiae]|uniref:VWA domain-containing protein n=1 Tax=Colwellia demingiae TaxID=89401 RepID=A0A5C6QGA2_9GAMM|nr:VWA domain-containing protein [Colwellia demingiae]TWX67783.1 VWA domain-containing protein [Colwellia demingiae]